MDSNGSASGQNQDLGPASHETLVEWYDASLIGNVIRCIEGTTSLLDSILTEPDLEHYSVEISVDVSVGGGAGCTHEDNGENVDYVVELIVLNNYTVT